MKPRRVTHKAEHYIKSYCIQILNKRQTTEVIAIKCKGFDSTRNIVELLIAVLEALRTLCSRHHLILLPDELDVPT